MIKLRAKAENFKENCILPGIEAAFLERSIFYNVFISPSFSHKRSAAGWRGT
jgi:hypothetical protein